MAQVTSRSRPRSRSRSRARSRSPSRTRGSNWTHEETLLLAELKLDSLEDASLNKKDGPFLWDAIAKKISMKFPEKTPAQCRGRWDNLVRDHRSVEEYCERTGKNYWSLNDKDLSSIKFPTAFGPEWYGIVKKVCDRTPRKRKASVTKPREASREPYVPLTPGPTSERTSEFEKPSLEEENLKLERENDALRRKVVQGQVTQQDQLSPEEKNQKLKEENALLTLKLKQMQPPQATQQHEEPLQDVLETDYVTVKTPEIEHAESEPAHSGLSDECPDDAQCNGAATVAEGSMLYDGETGRFDFEEYEPQSPIWGVDLSWFMSNLTLSTANTIAQISASTVSEGTITRQSSECNKSILEALDTNLDLQTASKVIELEIYLCCRGCVRKLRKKIEKVDGVQKVEFGCHRVIVTATAEPEVVLKQAQMAKKAVRMLSQKKLIAPKP